MGGVCVLSVLCNTKGNPADNKMRIRGGRGRIGHKLYKVYSQRYGSQKGGIPNGLPRLPVLDCC